MSNRSAAPKLDPHGSSEVLVEAAPAFSHILRDRTASVHREAERTGFIAGLIRGRATRAGYALFLRNFVPVYDCLETALDLVPEWSLAGGSREILTPFADRGLRRRDALRSDLRAIAGTAWETDLQVLPEAGLYARAIEATARDERLAAHAYARYLGDLSGGQILKPLLARTLGLTPDALAFYDFPLILDLSAPKVAMRAGLDHVDATGPVAVAIIEEALAAFRHNIAVSLAVQAASG